MSESARELIQRYAPDFPLRRCGRIHTDTTDFTSIGYGDLMAVGGKHYLVLRDEAERRFGLEDPKFWVKRCIELETGERRILKLEFYERFNMRIGHFEIRCNRSPAKEARILDLVRGDMRFMQGMSHSDEAGNSVRVLDVVRGKRLDLRVEDLPVDHETYFHDLFPDILEKFIGSCEAIRFLHRHDEQHGDIRRDHLLVEYETGHYRWIDFDYAFDLRENHYGLDLFGLGNILLFLTGKREHTSSVLLEDFESSLPDINPGDFTLMFANRFANLRKLYAYVPEALNNIILHFAACTEVFYETVDEFLADLVPCLDAVRRL